MTDSDRHHEIRELLVPYALRMLDAEQRSRVERALDSDPELRAELEAFERVGADLVGTVPRQPAPPELKQRVLAAVQAPAQREPLAHDAPAVAADEPPVDELARRRRLRRPWFGPAVTGALAAACVLLAFIAFDASGDLNSANERLERIEAELSDRTSAPAGIRGATPYPVSTTDEFSSAKGSLIRVSDDKWILAFNDVPEPGDGRSWQVWVASSAGDVRNVDQWQEGGTQLVVLDSDDIVEVMVSYEKTTRPVPTPGGEPVADIKL